MKLKLRITLDELLQKENKTKEEEIISLDALLYYLDEKITSLDDDCCGDECCHGDCDDECCCDGGCGDDCCCDGGCSDDEDSCHYGCSCKH